MSRTMLLARADEVEVGDLIVTGQSFGIGATVHQVTKVTVVGLPGATVNGRDITTCLPAFLTSPAKAEYVWRLRNDDYLTVGRWMA
jgi:hypothetical protein